MKVLIAGATGFIGRALCKELYKKYELIALSRDMEKGAKILDDFATVMPWDGKTVGAWAKHVNGAFALINLAGENVVSGYWTKLKKQKILDSRVESTRALLEAIKQADKRPKVFIQSSAVGYYGSRGDEPVDENSTRGTGFLSDVCVQCEDFAEAIEKLGLRCVVIRTGVVIGRSSGALVKLMRPFEFYLGGYFGTGGQWFSWISLDDEVSAIKFLLENNKLKGAFNLTSPEPVMLKDFCKALGKVLKSPSWTKVPGFVLRLMLGEMAEEMLPSGQKVVPKRLLEAGFVFRYEQLRDALNHVLLQER